MMPRLKVWSMRALMYLSLVWGLQPITIISPITTWSSLSIYSSPPCIVFNVRYVLMRTATRTLEAYHLISSASKSRSYDERRSKSLSRHSISLAPRLSIPVLTRITIRGCYQIITWCLILIQKLKIDDSGAYIGIICSCTRSFESEHENLAFSRISRVLASILPFTLQRAPQQLNNTYLNSIPESKVTWNLIRISSVTLIKELRIDPLH